MAISDRLAKSADQLEALINDCVTRFILPNNTQFMSGAVLSNQMIREDLSKFLTGLRGQSAAWHTGKFQGQNVRKDQLVSGLAPLMRDWSKVLNAWLVYGITGDGMDDLESLHRDLTSVASDAVQSPFSN